MKKSDWFTDWFNTKYYHILYKNRNEEDAQLFMRNITKFLQLPKKSHILDIPCGKGRHSIYLNSLGYKVTGVDLSINSIEEIKKFENNSLNFELKDMRMTLSNHYNAIFNLFTSFGYFENDDDDVLVLKNIKKSLKNNGVFVLDFLNVINVKEHLVPKEVKIVDGIQFNLLREIKNGFIVKNISFIDKKISYSFVEKVKYIDLKKFKDYFSSAGLKINYLFGDYQLTKFNPKKSDRLIIIAS
ncbi:MAG: Ubiquinone biosynthesis O-methyltransferase [Flavobacterium sp. SCGC AAA160-P02]|nr:MAG: Ubiquinone biosynthesis O-methyltransferase [Flavobacterium sp. SCGC AAA160-P02]